MILLRSPPTTKVASTLVLRGRVAGPDPGLEGDVGTAPNGVPRIELDVVKESPVLPSNRFPQRIMMEQLIPGPITDL